MADARWGRALLGLFGFALMAAYWPSINGAATSPRWAVLALGLVGLLFSLDVKVTLGHIAGALFLGWCTASYLWTATPLDSVDALLKLWIMAGLFVLGSSIADLRPFYLGAAAGLAVSSALVVLVVSGLVSYAQTSPPAGLFLNYLYLAEAAALVAVACGANGLWWAVGAVAPSLGLYHLARGPLVAVGAVSGLLGWRYSRRVGLLLAVGGALVVLGAVWLRPATVVDRFALWEDAWSGLTFFGRGFGSYFGAVPFFSTHIDMAAIRHFHPNNWPLELLFEVGVPGTILAMALCAILLDRRLGAERLVLIAFLVEGLVGFPFSLPATAGFVALVAGRAARDLPHWRDATAARRGVVRRGPVVSVVSKGNRCQRLDW
ncbi:MAG: hypothetical protein WC670_18340 [Pseudolabrys sp.]|jgi:hypothetical protein